MGLHMYYNGSFHSLSEFPNLMENYHVSLTLCSFIHYFSEVFWGDERGCFKKMTRFFPVFGTALFIFSCV